MPYDPDKDEVLKQWHCEETGLMVSIQRYDGGEAKVQIGPRISQAQGRHRTGARQSRPFDHRRSDVVL